MDNGFFGIYDANFDLDHDGELNAVEYDYMMEEIYEDHDEDAQSNDDEFDVDLYGDAEEFADDHIDDFESREEAMEYWEDNSDY